MTQQVERAIAEFAAVPDERRQLLNAEFARARTELDHIAGAIRQGIVTPTTRTMLESAERRVAEMEAAGRALVDEVPTLPSIGEAVEDYLSDLRSSLEGDIPAARELPARGVGAITLRPVGRQLMAEMRGNLAGLLGVSEEALCANDGAGSPTHTLASKFLVA